MPKIPVEFVKQIQDTVSETNLLEGELQYKSDDGTDRWLQSSVLPILDDNHCQIGEVVVRYDITQKKVLEKLSITDGLTKLYNRRYFDDTLNREIKRSRRSKSILSLIMFDVDFFKKYNDANGHKAGDDALIAIAGCVKRSLNRGSDFAFRIGGEEFAIIFSNLSNAEAVDFAEQIRVNVENLNIHHSNSTVSEHITISVGLLSIDYSQENIDSTNFYTLADDALYKAKNSGRNQVIVHEAEELELF